MKWNVYPQNPNDFEFDYYRDRVIITIGSWRKDEFFRLLHKIVNGDFDQITTGEIWCVENLLESYKDLFPNN